MESVNYGWICRACGSRESGPTGYYRKVIGGLVLGVSVLAAASTHDANMAITATPLALTGLALVVSGKDAKCPKCRTANLIPVHTPAGAALAAAPLPPAP